MELNLTTSNLAQRLLNRLDIATQLLIQNNTGRNGARLIMAQIVLSKEAIKDFLLTGVLWNLRKMTATA